MNDKEKPEEPKLEEKQRGKVLPMPKKPSSTRKLPTPPAPPVPPSPEAQIAGHEKELIFARGQLSIMKEIVPIINKLHESASLRETLALKHIEDINKEAASQESLKKDREELIKLRKEIEELKKQKEADKGGGEEPDKKSEDETEPTEPSEEEKEPQEGAEEVPEAVENNDEKD